MLGIGDIKKNYSSHKILGCEWEYFKQHIESQFEDGMAWGNHGIYWELDHVMPISFAMTEDEIYQLNYYMNFQPLTCEENNKKSNNIFYSDKTLQKCIDTWL